MVLKFFESNPSCGCKGWKKKEEENKIIEKLQLYMQDNSLHCDNSKSVLLLLRCHIFYQQDCQDDSPFASFCLPLSQVKTMESLGSRQQQKKVLKLVKKPRRLWLENTVRHVE